MNNWSLFVKIFINEAREFFSYYIPTIESIDNNKVARYVEENGKIVIFSSNKGVPGRIVIDDISLLEDALNDLIYNEVGFKFDYSEYMEIVSSIIKNLFLNMTLNDMKDILKFIKEYTSKMNAISETHPYSSMLMKNIKEYYTGRNSSVAMRNIGNSFVFTNHVKNDLNPIPPAVINNIDDIEITLTTFLEAAKNSNTYFNKRFAHFENEEASERTIGEILKNVSFSDLNDLNKFFKKYTQFLTDDTLEQFSHSVTVGKIFDKDLNVLRRNANINYETPHFLSYSIPEKNGFIELPNIRFGISSLNDKKTAHILAMQASQDNIFIEEYRAIEENVKNLVKNKGDIRYYNPMFIASLAITFGILNGLGVERIEFTPFLPLRFREKEEKEEKDEEYLNLLQQQLTNKNINNLVKMCEYFNGIIIHQFGETAEENLVLDISGINSCNNMFLSELYNVGYNITNSNTKQTSM